MRTVSCFCRTLLIAAGIVQAFAAEPGSIRLSRETFASLQGFSIPALSTRRVQTEIELETGQSFAIAGLLDNEMTDNMIKIPGLANIPLLGKLFTTKSLSKQNTELLILVTPEIVRPIPKGMPVPDLNRPKPFMQPNTAAGASQPSIDKTGPVEVHPPQPSVPY